MGFRKRSLEAASRSNDVSLSRFTPVWGMLYLGPFLAPSLGCGQKLAVKIILPPLSQWLNVQVIGI